MKNLFLCIITLSVVAQWSCNQPSNVASVTSITSQQTIAPASQTAVATDSRFNEYWYAGKAEISSYNYTINRYGEQRKGDNIFVFVTEDLSASKHVKLDDPIKAGNDRVPVLKLNALQRFQTGIYDYSMMTSLFTPIDIQNRPHSLKETTTVQDWCGHVFMQMNLKGNQYHTRSYSYFETEGDQELDTEGGAMLEDELFTRLRISPASLPSGTVKMIPNLTYTRLRHKQIKAFSANIETKESEPGLKVCTVNYPDIKRRIEIFYETAFPHKIMAFVEYDDVTVLSSAKLKKTVMSDYWTKNDSKSDPLRKELGL